MAGQSCDLPCDQENPELCCLSAKESEVLEYRLQFPVKCLCKLHYRDQFSRYNSWFKKCSDPCLVHTKPVKTQLKDISLDLARDAKKHAEFLVIPGQKVCKKCEHFLSEKIGNSKKDGESLVEEENSHIDNVDPNVVDDDFKVDSLGFDSPP